MGKIKFKYRSIVVDDTHHINIQGLVTHNIYHIMSTPNLNWFTHLSTPLWWRLYLPDTIENPSHIVNHLQQQLNRPIFTFIKRRKWHHPLGLKDGLPTLTIFDHFATLFTISLLWGYYKLWSYKITHTAMPTSSYTPSITTQERLPEWRALT